MLDTLGVGECNIKGNNLSVTRYIFIYILKFYMEKNLVFFADVFFYWLDKKTRRQRKPPLLSEAMLDTIAVFMI